MKCRHCGARLEHVFLDLGAAPPSNAYLNLEDLSRPETYYPLKIKVCDSCWLVQTEDYAGAADLFRSDYAYFSSTSSTWLKHAADYVDMIVDKLALGEDSYIVELASNDGYLLQNFVKRAIPCLGIEPTDCTAEAAMKKGVPVLKKFFGETVAQQLAEERKADLIIGNNVFAHVPDINDFTKGISLLLKQNGVVTLEFPHLMRLMEFCQFDTVYHEHYSYLSLHTVERIFKKVGLKIFDVEELPTHGGSIRVYGCHMNADIEQHSTVNGVLAEEKSRGMTTLQAYADFQSKSEYIKNRVLGFLLQHKKAGKKVEAYGAAAKGNTLLNFAGVKPDLLACVYDAASSKQGKYMPGSRIPIIPPVDISRNKPDILLMLPWNLAEEICEQLAYVQEWGGRFARAIPSMEIL